MNHIFPRRNPLIPLIELRDGAFTFGEYPEVLYLTDREKQWLIGLSGERSTADAIDLFVAQHANTATAESITSSSLHRIVRIGLESAGLIDSNTVPNISRWLPEKLNRSVESEMTHIHVQATPRVPTPNTAVMVDRRRSLRVHIVGTNYLGMAIKSLTARAGFTISDSARSASVLILPSVSHPLVSDHDFAEREQLPHVHVGIRHAKSVVGPLVLPGKSSCVRCDYLHRRDLDPTWPSQFIGWRHAHAQSTADSLLVHLTAAFSLSVLRDWIDGNEAINLAWSASMPIPCFTAENRPPHPLCGCQLAHHTDYRDTNARDTNAHDTNARDPDPRAVHHPDVRAD